MAGVKRLLVLLGLLGALGVGALGSSPAANASSPVPWCGTDVVSADRLPDATFGFAVHIIYAHAQGSPDRFADWAPRIAGDVTAIDAWWRTQDPTRAPRFDLFSFPCSTVFGALDISRVSLAAPIGTIGPAFGTLRTAAGDELPCLGEDLSRLLRRPDRPDGHLARLRAGRADRVT